MKQDPNNESNTESKSLDMRMWHSCLLHVCIFLACVLFSYWVVFPSLFWTAIENLLVLTLSNLLWNAQIKFTIVKKSVRMFAKIGVCMLAKHYSGLRKANNESEADNFETAVEGYLVECIVRASRTLLIVPTILIFIVFLYWIINHLFLTALFMFSAFHLFVAKVEIILAQRGLFFPFSLPICDGDR